MLAGLDPRDGSPLRGSSSAVRVAGFDLTFSAPKSVSVLFGVGDGELRGRGRRSARPGGAGGARLPRAVGRGGPARAWRRARRAGDGLVAAAFRHRTSRAGDPQLHTHVLVANLGRGPDGRWSALDGRRLYAHARAASFVYQAVLRGELTRTLGRRVAAGPQGDRRGRRRPEAGAAGVQPAAGGDRGGARPSAGRRVRARPRRRRWRRGARRRGGVERPSSSRSGGRGRRSSGSAASELARLLGRVARVDGRRRRRGSACSTSSRRRPG